MRLTVHQPQYFPYPGFFNKLSMADTFVIMDDVQYDKRFTNRNRILNPQGPMWLSVPIVKADKFQPNMQVRINNSIGWRQDHLKKLVTSYTNTKFFERYRDDFERVYSQEWSHLFELDYQTVKMTMGWLDINVPIVKESELKVSSTGTQRIIDVCKATGADTYVSGRGGKAYMDENLFAKNEIHLVYQRYSARPYPQRFMTQFVPDLSIIDMLVNVGPESASYVKQIQSNAADPLS